MKHHKSATSQGHRGYTNDPPPWQEVYQQTQQWLASGVFEQIVSDLRAVLRFVDGRAERPTAAIFT